MSFRNVVFGLSLLLVVFSLSGCGGGTSSDGPSPLKGGTGSDLVAPEVSSTTPVDGATGIATNTAINAVFSEAIDAASIVSPASNFTVLNITNPAAPVVITGLVSLSGAVATFTPNTPLAENAQFQATISSDVQDSAGNNLAADFVWGFSTGAAPDTIAPTVNSTTPAGGAGDVGVDSAVTATFSEVIAPATIESPATAFTLQNVSIPAAPVAIAGTVTFSGLVATFTPTTALPPNTPIEARISTAAKDLAGNPLAQDFVWTFTTGAAELVPPTVANTIPADGATGISQNTLVIASFDETIAAATIESPATTFTLQDVTKSPSVDIAGTVSLSGTLATFTPTADLPADTTIEARLTTGVQDLSGNALAEDYVWRFTTGSLVDTTAPTVTATDPADGLPNVSIASAITVDFDEAMDPASLTPATFTVGDLHGTVTLAGNQAVFTPTIGLAPGITYTATITTGARDLAGNALASPFTFEFTTADLAWGGTIQIGDVEIDEAWGVTTDDAGNVYVVGDTSNDLETGSGPLPGEFDFFVAKYSPDGVASLFLQDGTGVDDDAFAVAVDKKGNIYVAGNTAGNFAGIGTAPDGITDFSDGFVIKYDPAGKDVWVRQFGTGKTDVVNSMKLDASGNVYVVGLTEGDFGDPDGDPAGSDAFVLKLDNDGNQVWVRQYGTDGADDAFALDIGASGKVYVTGATGGLLSSGATRINADFYVAVFSGVDGTRIGPYLQVASTVDEFSAVDDFGTGIAVDAAGNIYVGGQTNGDILTGAVGDNDDIFIAKFIGGTGTPEVKQFGTPLFDDAFGGIVLDSQDNLYITGETDGALEGNAQLGEGDAYLAKFDAATLGAASAPVWTSTFGTVKWDFSTRLTLAPGGDLFVAGITQGDLAGPGANADGASPDDGFLVKFDANGNLLP